MAKSTDQNEAEYDYEDYESEDEAPAPRLPLFWRLLGGTFVLAILLVGSFELAYLNKVYPGVSANGVYLGGLSQAGASARLADKISDFTGHSLPITYGDTTVRIPVNTLNLKYDSQQSIAQAYQYGRQGDIWHRISEQAGAILGRPANFSTYTYNDTKLEPYLSDISDDVATPTVDASLTFNDDKTQVTPAKAGSRLNIGRLVALVGDRLSSTDISTISAPVYALAPVVDTPALEQIANRADVYIAGPLTISYNDTTKTIERNIIIDWLKVNHRTQSGFMTTHDLADLYPVSAGASLALDSAAIKTYITTLASKIDQAPHNATLGIQDSHVAVTDPSRNGVTLDQAGALDAITRALTEPAEDRTVTLSLKVVKPDVSEENLDQLGIKELMSEGVTYFPGSTQARLTNVRVGASKYNGVLLKPDQVFSFGEILGDVGPEQGYKPELVILGDHEEKQYGGGLCQVSSTAFRAALNAGLPIIERHNHSFAVSYYTAPYNVPGVDATIYYPGVDFKFKNDTGHYMLIQTHMEGTSLKFEYYGTKTKSGVIRGPEFISGSNDATQPSHTVFYRDVLDLDGKVTKTDTFNTYYKSSKDFPVQQQFN